MKRTALKRKTPIRRKRKTPRRVDPARVRSEEHKAKVRALGVCASGYLHGARCSGRIEASHNDYDGTKGAGLKTSDLTCIPQCSQCHRDVAQLKGPFEGWTKRRRKEWFDIATRATQLALLTREHADLSECPF